MRFDAPSRGGHSFLSEDGAVGCEADPEELGAADVDAREKG